MGDEIHIKFNSILHTMIFTHQNVVQKISNQEKIMKPAEFKRR